MFFDVFASFFGGARYNQSGFPCIIMIFTILFGLSIILSIAASVFFIRRELKLKNGVVKDTLENGDYALMFFVSVLSVTNILFSLLSTFLERKKIDFLLVIALLMLYGFTIGALSDYSKKTYIYGRAQLGYHFKTGDPYAFKFTLYQSALAFFASIPFSLIYFSFANIGSFLYRYFDLSLCLTTIIVLSVFVCLIGLFTLKKSERMFSSCLGIIFSALSFLFIIALTICSTFLFPYLMDVSDKASLLFYFSMIGLVLGLTIFSIFIVGHVAPDVFDRYYITFNIKSMLEHINIYAMGYSVLVSLISVSEVIIVHSLSLI